MTTYVRIHFLIEMIIIPFILYVEICNVEKLLEVHVIVNRAINNLIFRFLDQQGLSQAYFTLYVYVLNLNTQFGCWTPILSYVSHFRFGYKHMTCLLTQEVRSIFGHNCIIQP